MSEEKSYNKMKVSEIKSVDILICGSEVLKITWSEGIGWRGTPETNGQETAKLAIEFLKKYVN